MSGSKPAKMPRASLAVSILDDPDYLILMETAPGRAAFAAFVALLMAAKAQRNGGTFRESIEVVAKLCRWRARDLTNALAVIDEACKKNNNSPWVVRSRDQIIIRNYLKWNKLSETWGGQRVGAGRKSTAAKNQDDNQDDSNLDSSCGASVSGPVPVPNSEKSKSAAAAAASPESAKPATPRKRNPIWDVVVEIFKLDPVTKDEQRRVGKVVRDLKAKGADADSIRATFARYRVAWPSVECTPEALLKHWDRFVDSPVNSADAVAEVEIERTQRRLAELRGGLQADGSATP